MAGLCWMAVVLAFSLSAGNTEAMELNDVQKIVKYIRNKYSIHSKNIVKKEQFSLAVNIPENQDLNRLQDLFNDDDADTVKNTVKNGDVYKGTNVVEAMLKKMQGKSGKEYTEHAEARVLDNIQRLAHCSKGNNLVFYSYLSPCGKKCANRNHYNNILDKIDNIPNDKWEDGAFVFSKVFDWSKGPNGEDVFFPVNEIKDTLKNLRETKFGHNIFRCFPGKRIRCIECFDNNGELLDDCVKNNRGSGRAAVE